MRRFVAWCALVAGLVFAALAFAAPPSRLPPPATAPAVLAITGDSGARSVELGFDGERFSAAFVVRNDGTTPAKVNRIVPRMASDGRLVPGLGAETEGGPIGTLEPGASKRGVVRWKPAGATRELYAFVGAEPEKGETAWLAVHAEKGFAERALASLLVWLPLAIAALARFLLQGREERTSGASWRAVETLALIEVALAVFAALRIDRAPEAPPLAYVERVALGSSLEYFVGLSGATAGAFVVVTAAFAVALLLARGRGALGLGLAATGLLGALAAQNGILLVVFLGAGLAGLASSLRGEGGEAELRGSRAFGLVAAGATLLVAFALASIARSAPLAPSFSGVANSWSLPDAGATTWALRLAGGGTTALGPSGAATFIKLVTLAAVLGLGMLVPAPGLGEWLGRVLRSAPRPALALVAGAVPPVAATLLVRLSAELLPNGVRWMAPTLVWAGVIGLVVAAVRALRATDLRELLGAALSAQGAVVLVGLGSLVPQGVEAALTAPLAAGAASLLFVLAASHIEDFAGTSSLARLGGVARSAPSVGAALVVSLGTLAGLPASFGAHALVLALFGAMPRYPALALVFGLAWALLATALVARLLQALRGPIDPELSGSVRLEPFGGRFPELRGPSGAVALGLVLALVALGLWPRPLLSLLDARSLEIHRKLDPPGLLQVS